MTFDEMSREQLIEQIRELTDYVENIFLWWGKREFREMFEQIAGNEDGEYSAQEVQTAKTLLESEGAFDEFIDLVRDSFERGGINYVLTEKLSALMQEVAERRHVS
ncbi:MAG TPA: hypothetical protein VK463_18445 [Desulfomonilaceae bacterium]|nr:hypothetical protein [Desulfomonilaceae bacterium]